MKITIDAENLDMAISGLLTLKRELTDSKEYSLGNSHRINRMYPVTGEDKGFMLRITKSGYTVRELVRVQGTQWGYRVNLRNHHGGN
jgi:hypothetical protein